MIHLLNTRKSLVKQIADRKANEAKVKKEDEAMEKIIEAAKMDIPEAMVDTQVNRMAEDFAQKITAAGIIS